MNVSILPTFRSPAWRYYETALLRLQEIGRDEKFGTKWSCHIVLSMVRWFNSQVDQALTITQTRRTTRIICWVVEELEKLGR